MINPFRYTRPELYEKPDAILLRQGYGGQGSRQPFPLPAPRSPNPPRWPDYIMELTAQKIVGELGVGDTAERVIGSFGSSAFKCWYDAKTGFKKKPCSCTKSKWNAWYRY